MLSRCLQLALFFLIALSNSAIAANEFAAGSARVSEVCKIQFDARSNGGHVTEQCDFEAGKELYAGPVLCFKAAGNRATFVWQFQNSSEELKQGWYQQVYIVDNGAPGQGTPDEFKNDPEVENLGALCDDLLIKDLSIDFPGTGPVKKGNLVVSTEESEE